MNYEQFSFFNYQLAAMLREGIPLEGALQRLSAEMLQGGLRREIQLLEADLISGMRLEQAIGQRKLPGLYVNLVQIGARSNDLPAMLTQLADYYQRVDLLWTRLKGILLYPLLVSIVALGLTIVVWCVLNRLLPELPEGSRPPISALFLKMWLPPLVLGGVVLGGAGALVSKRARGWLRWRVPLFRDASLAQVAGSLAMLLRNGLPLSEALSLVQSLEANTIGGRGLEQWRAAVAAGQGSPRLWGQAQSSFPGLFVWLVRRGGEDVVAGLQTAAEVYQRRARYRIELSLYGALPVSVLVLGSLVAWQVVCAGLVFARIMDLFAMV